MTCHWFNVPEDLTGTTGAITIYKFACPVTVPPAGYDWHNRCNPQGQRVRFRLSLDASSPIVMIMQIVRARSDGAPFVPVIVAATDSDGILRLPRLQPGVYTIEEVDAAWCHAESDRANAQGHVIVEAGKRSSVWIFDCIGVEDSPNTGAGPVAGPESGAGGSRSGAAGLPGTGTSVSLGLGLLWPLAGLVALRRRRRAA
jgi:hypothetical protein